MDEPHVHTRDMDVINKFIYKDLDIFKHNDVNEKYSFIYRIWKRVDNQRTKNP